MKDKSKKLDEVLEKGKKILDYFDRLPLPYVNPFSEKNEPLDTLDHIDVLEYSKLTERQSASISLSESQSTVRQGLNLKEYDTILLKIEDLSLTPDLVKKFDHSPICIECKVPLYIKQKETQQFFYDTFK